jgi:hypothetical protein
VRSVTKFNIFVAFAFTVMADPVSSVAYAIEAALHSLDGDLSELLWTMGLVVATIAVIAATYHQLIARFPRGGGGPRSVATAFGEGWAFLPLAALLVDFALTAAISCAAGASALIAYQSALADARTWIAVGLAVLVAVGICFGHRGRVVFATATLLFLLIGLVVLLDGIREAAADRGSPQLLGGEALAIVLAMPLGMALATGVESPSDAIAHLRLSDRGRRQVGQVTIWLMVSIVSALTVGLTALAVALDVGLPPADSTLLAEIGRAATGGGTMFALFQVLTALLLLAATASAFAAASGLLKALAEHGGDSRGLLPARLARTNRAFVPYWGVAAVLVATCGLIVLASGRDQEIVHFYAVAVFLSFLGATAGCARLNWRDGRRSAFAVNLLGTVLVGFVLVLNALRPAGAIAIAGTVLLALWLWRTWASRGRPSGVAGVTVRDESSH